ncbi:hypothetical protein I317_05242 [Kwoniella heveanensis CBS 569]|nr:hypothetical protein I317_05242 [Kwoniella heveanensis CBS 569]
MEDIQSGRYGSEAPAETSKAGLRRMRRIHAQPPSLGSTHRGAMNPLTSDLIYAAPPHSRVQGYLTSSVFSASRPRPLPTPSVLTPPKQLSLSPDGRWSVFFHPNPSDEGGTLAIYSSTIYSPLSTPNNVVPLATFPLISRPLAVTHLYPPRIHLVNGRAPPFGPKPPPNHDSTRGPTFLVLQSSGLLLFHPQAIPTPGPIQIDGQIPISAGETWTMNVLRAPLHMRWHAAAGGVVPPEDGWSVDRGWMGLVPGNRGVWVGWEKRDGQVGVTRAAVDVDSQGHYFIQVTPMPSLPRTDQAANYLQSIVFVAPSNIKNDKIVKNEDGAGDVQMNVSDGPSDLSSGNCESVKAVLIYHETEGRSTSSCSRTVVHTFERREVNLAEGFREIGSGGGDVVSSYDWGTLPQATTDARPAGTTIVALYPLPAVPPHSHSLAVVSHLSGLLLVHIDLLSQEWFIFRESIDLDEVESEVDIDLIVSQGVKRGQLGLAALLRKEGGPVLVVQPSIEGQAALSTLSGSTSATSLGLEEASGIILAERQGVDWSDVIRDVCGSTWSGEQHELVSGILRGVYELAIEEIHIDEQDLLLRVQIALFSVAKDVRLDLASDILRLSEVSSLVDKCATFEEDGRISFDLDSIWPLIGAMEWVVTILAGAMRQTIIYGAKLEWSSAQDNEDEEDPSSVLILAHPTFRALSLRLLSQLNQLTTFLSTLERPILQPESRALPDPIQRDPMATIVARERIKDAAYAMGFDILEWGKGLEHVSNQGLSEDQQRLSLLELDLKPLQATIPSLLSALPSSSTLFLSPEQNALSSSSGQNYDGITFQRLSNAYLNGNLRVKCDRCESSTDELGSIPPSITTTTGNEDPGNTPSPWITWKRAFAQGCLCGGRWSRVDRNKVGRGGAE